MPIGIALYLGKLKNNNSGTILINDAHIVGISIYIALHILTSPHIILWKLPYKRLV